MKINKVLCVILALCMFFLCGCGSKPANVSSDRFGNQDAFLADMAKGISKRIKNLDDEKERTDEELYAYYEELVGYELDLVGKYENVTFDDELFNDLAHEYIMSCKAQKTGAENFKKLASLWNAANSTRNIVIRYFYENYDLPITSEEASQDSTIGPSIVISTGSNNFQDKVKTHETIIIGENNSILLYEENQVSVWFDSINEEYDGDYTIRVRVVNKSDSKFGCCIGTTYVNDVEIIVPTDTGFIFTEAGKTKYSNGSLEKSELEDKKTGKPKKYETCLEIYDENIIKTDIIPILINPSLFPNL